MVAMPTNTLTTVLNGISLSMGWYARCVILGEEI